MIATHNIKVNGRWYSAGDKLPEEAPKQEQMVIKPVVQETPAPAEEEPKAVPKPRTASTRRKNVK